MPRKERAAAREAEAKARAKAKAKAAKKKRKAGDDDDDDGGRGPPGHSRTAPPAHGTGGSCVQPDGGGAQS